MAFWKLVHLCLFSYTLKMCNASNILIYSPSYSRSHLIMNARIADELANNGHNVVMFIPEYEPTDFNDTKLAKVIKMSIISEEYIKLLNDYSSDLFASHTASFQSRIEWEVAAANLCEGILKRKEELEILRSYNFKIGFSEQIDLCGVGIIRYLDIPNHIWISSCPIMESITYNIGVPTPLSYVPVTEDSDFSTVMSFRERLKNFYMWIWAIYIHRYGTDLITNKFRKYIDNKYLNVREIASESSIIFVNSDEFLDVTRPILHKIIYIGGIGITEKPKSLNKEFSNMMSKGEKGVIIVSFGTMVSTSGLPDKVRYDLLKVFSELKEYHFIMKVDKGDHESYRLSKDIPNVDLVNWMPQSDLLGHPRLRLFINHGGFNGLMESAIRSVPTLIIPFFGDQFRNARAAEHIGIGLALQKYDIKYDKLKSKISNILNDKKYAIAVKRISSMMINKPNKPRDQLIKWTQFVADYGPLPELRVYGDTFNTIKYFGIDIIAFVAGLFAAIALLVIRIIITTIRYFIKKSVPPAKKHS